MSNMMDDDDELQHILVFLILFDWNLDTDQRKDLTSG
jgi:hypothetical protein